MLLLGVLQAQAAGAGPVVATDFDLLETQVLDSAQSSVTFSSLSTYAADYQHLQIRMTARTTGSTGGGGTAVNLRFNADSGSNYRAHQLYGDGSSVVSNQSGAVGQIGLQRIADGGAPANAYGAIVVDILDSFSSNKNTTIRQLGGNPSSFIFLNSGAWFNTASLTEVYLAPAGGTNFTIGSRFSLYGVKGSA